jgi:hypothetical protein
MEVGVFSKILKRWRRESDQVWGIKKAPASQCFFTFFNKACSIVFQWFLWVSSAFDFGSSELFFLFAVATTLVPNEL